MERKTERIDSDDFLMKLIEKYKQPEEGEYEISDEDEENEDMEECAEEQFSTVEKRKNYILEGINPVKN